MNDSDDEDDDNDNEVDAKSKSRSQVLAEKAAERALVKAKGAKMRYKADLKRKHERAVIREQQLKEREKRKQVRIEKRLEKEKEKKKRMFLQMKEKLKARMKAKMDKRAATKAREEAREKERERKVRLKEKEREARAKAKSRAKQAKAKTKAKKKKGSSVHSGKGSDDKSEDDESEDDISDMEEMVYYDPLIRDDTDDVHKDAEMKAASGSSTDTSAGRGLGVSAGASASTIKEEPGKEQNREGKQTQKRKAVIMTPPFRLLSAIRANADNAKKKREEESSRGNESLDANAGTHGNTATGTHGDANEEEATRSFADALILTDGTKKKFGISAENIILGPRRGRMQVSAEMGNANSTDSDSEEESEGDLGDKLMMKRHRKYELQERKAREDEKANGEVLHWAVCDEPSCSRWRLIDEETLLRQMSAAESERQGKKKEKKKKTKEKKKQLTANKKTKDKTGGCGSKDKKGKTGKTSEAKKKKAKKDSDSDSEDDSDDDSDDSEEDEDEEEEEDSDSDSDNSDDEEDEEEGEGNSQKFFCGGLSAPDVNECLKLDHWIVKCVGPKIAQHCADLGIHTIEAFADLEEEKGMDDSKGEKKSIELADRLHSIGLYFDTTGQAICEY